LLPAMYQLPSGSGKHMSGVSRRSPDFAPVVNSMSDGIIGALSLRRPPEIRNSSRSSGATMRLSTCLAGLRANAAVAARTGRDGIRQLCHRPDGRIAR